MVQVILALVVVGLLMLVTYFIYHRRKNERPDLEEYKRKTDASILQGIKNEFADMTKQDDIILTNDVNYEALKRNKERILDAFKMSMYGVPSARKIIISIVRDILSREFTTREECIEFMDFDNILLLQPLLKWEILLSRLSKKHGRHVIKYLENTYQLSEPRVIDNGYSDKLVREFDFQLLDFIFEKEIVERNVQNDYTGFSHAEIIDILAIKFYQIFHGFGCIDTLLQQNVDGINLGVSGSIRYEIDGNYDTPYRTVNSVWVQVDAKWVLFSFLDFFTVKEMRRVTNQAISWGNRAPMTEKRPYKVCEGYDGSRRFAIRPQAGESWALFIRNFVIKSYDVKFLLDKTYVKNWELPATLLYYLMKAEQSTAFTGPMNSGKTSLMKAMIEFVDLKNIRVLEMSFELALREIYSNKNIFIVKPTDFVTSSTLQDLLKKSDGWFSMVGEVAEDIVAARMIQFILVASAFTIFSSHHNDDDSLINGLRNSLVASGEYTDSSIAESLVLDAIHHNCHLGMTIKEERVVKYISEIIKENEVSGYPEIKELVEQARVCIEANDPSGLSEVLVAQMMLDREYYTRTTDRVKHSSRVIIEFNEETGEYLPKEWYTVETMQKIMTKLPQADRQGFVAFYRKYWRC